MPSAPSEGRVNEGIKPTCTAQGQGPYPATSRSQPHSYFNMENMTEARWATAHMLSRNPTDCRRARACGLSVWPFLYEWDCEFVCVAARERTRVCICVITFNGVIIKHKKSEHEVIKHSAQETKEITGTISPSGRDKRAAWLKQTRRKHKSVQLKQIYMRRKRQMNLSNQEGC